MTPLFPSDQANETAVPGPSVDRGNGLSLCNPALSAEAQYLADLIQLSKIEAQRECFFDVMGELRHDQLQKKEVANGTA